MPVIYRTAGAWGAGKGGNLTPVEVDGNFWDVDQRIETVLAGLVPVEIVSVGLSGSQLTFTLSDSTVLGPVTVPLPRLAWRSDWAATTAYARNDMVRVAGEGLFIVAEDHTSPGAWDEAHLVGGDPAYILAFAEPRATVTTVATTTHTLAAASVYAYHRFTHASGCTITVPANATVALPVGTEFHLRQSAAGGLTISAAVGVTINIPTALEASTDREGAVVTVKKIGADEWDLFGLLAVAP